MASFTLRLKVNRLSHGFLDHFQWLSTSERSGFEGHFTSIQGPEARFQGPIRPFSVQKRRFDHEIGG